MADQAVLPLITPVVPVCQGQPVLPGHHRSTTAPRTEGHHPYAVLGAVVQPELPATGTTGPRTGTTAMHKTALSQMTYGDLSLHERRLWWVQSNCVRVLIHPIPSDVGSLLIVRISYDQRNKRVGNTVFDLFRLEGRPNRLAPHNVYLSKL
jgi:hypothetical protein